MMRLLIVARSKMHMQIILKYLSSISHFDGVAKKFNEFILTNEKVRVSIIEDGTIFLGKRFDKYIYFGDNKEYENEVLKPTLCNTEYYKEIVGITKEDEQNATSLLGNLPKNEVP